MQRWQLGTCVPHIMYRETLYIFSCIGKGLNLTIWKRFGNNNWSLFFCGKTEDVGTKASGGIHIFWSINQLPSLLKIRDSGG